MRPFNYMSNADVGREPFCFGRSAHNCQGYFGYFGQFGTCPNETELRHVNSRVDFAAFCFSGVRRLLIRSFKLSAPVQSISSSAGTSKNKYVRECAILVSYTHTHTQYLFANNTTLVVSLCREPSYFRDAVNRLLP